MFPQLFKINARELSNRYEQLHGVGPQLPNFISRNFDESQQAHEIRHSLDVHFHEVLRRTVLDDDNRLYSALETILKNAGTIDIDQHLDVGLSSRQLRRLFDYYIGTTAKTFSKVVRFQHVLSARSPILSFRNNHSFLAAGYYDQSHFIKEFKNFYGITPGKVPSR